MALPSLEIYSIHTFMLSQSHNATDYVYTYTPLGMPAIPKSHATYITYTMTLNITVGMFLLELLKLLQRGTC